MAIVIGDITSGTISGGGDFDVLVRAAKEHLMVEYSAGRITGDTYAQAYIAIVNQVLAQAIQFRLGAEQINVQSGLTDEQLKLVIAQTEQVKADTLNIPKQGIVLDKQADQLDGQILILAKQADQTVAQTAQVTAETANVPKQGELLDKQVLQVAAQTSQVTAETLNVPKQGILLDKQAINLDKQLEQITSTIKLTDQKTVTEKAQVADVIDGATVEGTVGKQKEVYDAQIKGFKDDALQKATKTMTDIWSVQRSTDAGIQPTAETNLFDLNIGSAVSELFGSLSIPVEPAPKVAWVSITSTTDLDEIVGSGMAKLTGNIGTYGSSIRSTVIKDKDDKVVTVTGITVGADKSFTKTNIDVSTLAVGPLTVSMKILTAQGTEITVTDSVTKK